jgi:hypothetical protein
MAKKTSQRKVTNRNNYKIEVPFGGKIIVFPPMATICVPDNMDIPDGLGLKVSQ